MTAGDPTGSSVALARRYAPDLVPVDAVERAITVDQSNRSVVVGERVVVKWLTPPQPFPHPGVTLLRHLTEVGFMEMPAFLGAHVEGGHVVAMVTQYMAGALDGWNWFVDDLTTALDSGDLQSTMHLARRIGALAARLHDALATPSSVVGAPARVDVLAAEHVRAERLVADAIAATAGAAGARLAARAGRIRAAIDALDTPRLVAVQPIHGDLHVGQLLRSADTIWVNDFDGNPIAEPDEGDGLRTPLVDLASLLQSIDHVGRIVQKRRPADHDAIELWIAVAVPAALDAYEQARADVAAAAGNIRRSSVPDDASRSIVPPSPATSSPPRRRLVTDDAPVLFALRVVQELHEYLYAARSLPVWLYVPDGALTAMFAED